MERINELEQTIKKLDPKIKLLTKVKEATVEEVVKSIPSVEDEAVSEVNADGGAETTVRKAVSEVTPSSSSNKAGDDVDEGKPFSFSTAGKLAAAAASGRVYSKTDADVVVSSAASTASSTSSSPRELSARSPLDELARRASKAKAATSDTGKRKSAGGRSKGTKKQSGSMTKKTSSKAGSKKK